MRPPVFQTIEMPQHKASPAFVTAVVVTDLLVSMPHQNHESARALAGTAEGEALARKLDALGGSLLSSPLCPPPPKSNLYSVPRQKDTVGPHRNPENEKRCVKMALQTG